MKRNKLKSMPIIKNTLIVIAIPIFIFLNHNYSKCYENLEEQNHILLDQKQLYEEILQLNPNDTKEKALLLKCLSVADSMYEYKNPPYNISVNGWGLMLISFIVISFYIYRLIDKKEKEYDKENKSDDNLTETQTYNSN